MTEKLDKRAGPVKFDYFKSYDGSEDGDGKLEQAQLDLSNSITSNPMMDLKTVTESSTKRAGPVKFDYFQIL